MKKNRIFPALAVMTAICLLFFAWSVGAETTVKLGDIDGSGAVDSDDLTALSRFVARIEIPTAAQKSAADVTKDGNVDSDDLTRMAQYVAHLISSFDSSEKPSFDDPGSYIVIHF